MMGMAAVVLSRRGWELARKLVPEGRVHAPAALGLGVPFTSLRRVVEELFSTSEALVMVMATGIAVRVLAPHLRDKFSDPAVVVVDEGGQFAVSLVGGHRGANELAERVARTLGAQPVVTTASEVLGRPAIDVFARRHRCHLGPRAHLAGVAGALVRGEPVVVLWDRTLPRVDYPWPPEAKVLDWGPQEAWPEEPCAALVVVTVLAVPAPPGPHLLLRPRRWVAGVGCRRGTPAGEILEAIRETTSGCGLAPESVGALATLDKKRDEPGLLEAARLLGAELRFYPARELAACLRAVPPGSVAESPFVKRTVGVANVCELAAMLAAGTRELRLPKRVHRGVTVALARGPWP